MENNKKNELQLNGLKKALSNPMDGKALSGALPDDALEGVAGGAVLDSSFYIAKCNRCGWQSCPFDNRGENDLTVIVVDHCTAHPDCEGDFSVFNRSEERRVGKECRL